MNTALGTEWAKHVKGEPKNDFLTVITASSKTPVSGTGKTTLALHLAKQMDMAGGFDAAEQATLDAGDIAYEMLPDLDSGSAILWDEAQGTPGKEGLDARRAMKETSIQALNSVLANRNKNFSLVVIAQQFSMLDPRLYPLIDAWVLIHKAPSHPRGPEGTAYNVYVEDYDLKNPDIRTEAIEDITWPAIDHDDEDYQHLEALKEEAKTQAGGDDKQEPSKQEQAKTAKIIKADTGVPWNDIPDADHPLADSLTYSGSELRKEYRKLTTSDSENRQQAVSSD